ncbi:TAXI family TRAP transporter solute-binding subunit [Reyranella sp.]|uniref:TAXI family TRAP transporter solute-binding subunit n=1 Tax=Reyranella sp. TaxID=1929291 RepID=UPI003BAC02E1
MAAGTARPRGAAANSLTLRLGTASPGGGFIVYAGAFVNGLRLANPDISIRPVATAGSVENVSLLESGEVDIGLVFGEVARARFHPSSGPPTGLKVICTVYLSPGMFVVRADTRYRRIEELKGRPVVWNGRNSALALQGRYVMAALGLDPEKDFEPVYTPTMIEGPTMILDGTASALWGAGKRWPGFVKIASSPYGARFIVPDADQVDRIVSQHAFMQRVEIPPGRYPGQSDPVLTVGSWSYVLARPDLDEAAGYTLAVALRKLERSNTLFEGHLAESTARNTLAALPRPDALHPGVARYYRELGLI